MKPGYSFKKSFGKGVMFLLQGALAAATIAGFTEVSLWDLITEYVKPVVGTLTVGGVLALATNYVKYNWLA